MRYLMTGLAALALGATASAAAAQDMVVKYDDLDLTDAKAQKTLDQRIERAAREYCGAGRVVTGTRIVTSATACVASARNAARQQMASLVEKAQRGG